VKIWTEMEHVFVSAVPGERGDSYSYSNYGYRCYCHCVACVVIVSMRK